MNVDNIKAVRDAIKLAPEHHFFMGRYLRDVYKGRMFCGTAGCIAGFAAVISTSSSLGEHCDTIRARCKDEISHVGADFLGISDNQASVLFSPSEYIVKNVRKRHAVAILDRLLEKGEINTNDWMEVVK